MALTPTGSISFDQVRTELGATGAISFNDTNVRRLAYQTSGTVTADSLQGTSWVGSNVTNINAFTRLGSPSTVRTYKLAINSGVAIGATSGNTALTVGQFPTGSTLQINNWGNINGYGGAGGSGGAGSAGGDAIYANYANQTVVINNQSGATIYAGGGGGGRGGNGGTGGTGGQGSYTATTDGPKYQPAGHWAFGATFGATSYGNNVHTWALTFTKAGAASETFIDWYNPATYYESAYGGYTTLNSSYRLTGHYTSYGSLRLGTYRASPTRANVYEIYAVGTLYSSGGAGGGGGAGGAGGRGYGYDGVNAGGSAGSSGAAGAAGGTNAGAGGQGGTGGTGGAGGTWGTAGSTGNTGNTGATGASGNYTGGSAGSAGVGGSGGGAAGRYLVKGSSSVTVNNSGSLAGSLA